MDDIEDIRRRKLEEYQKKIREQDELRKQRLELEIVKEKILSQILTPEAKSRLKNVELANPALAQKIISLLVTLYQNGRIPRKITDKELKAILAELSQTKREPKILFKRK